MLKLYLFYVWIIREGLEVKHFTKLASYWSCQHSPKALSMVTFFLGSGRDSASIMGLCGFGNEI